MIKGLTSLPNTALCLHTVTTILLISVVQSRVASQEKVFEFPEYDYVESPKNEIAWAQWEAACEQTPVCLGLMDLEKVRCVRKCISPSCYNDLYAFDELEEGEIDIRFHPFKGCFASMLARRRL